MNEHKYMYTMYEFPHISAAVVHIVIPLLRTLVTQSGFFHWKNNSIKEQTLICTLTWFIFHKNINTESLFEIKIKKF